MKSPRRRPRASDSSSKRCPTANSRRALLPWPNGWRRCRLINFRCSSCYAITPRRTWGLPLRGWSARYSTESRGIRRKASISSRARSRRAFGRRSASATIRSATTVPDRARKIPPSRAPAKPQAQRPANGRGDPGTQYSRCGRSLPRAMPNDPSSLPFPSAARQFRRELSPMTASDTTFPDDDGGFRLRGQELSRVEALSDVVFGFALTLLGVSAEVPKTFDQLLVIMREFPAFAICFAILISLWHDHYRFFRRYGLQDRRTIFLNGLLLFIVILYV